MAPSAALNSLCLVWSALWRAQVSHLVVFAAIPALSALVQAAIGIVVLPFLLLGFGDRAHGIGIQIHHLSSFGCWVMLASCSAADHAIMALPQLAGQSREVGAEPFFGIPSDINLRHVWFALWLGWFVWFLVRRERSRRTA
jgi:hypothetical protein